jgi:hypothetical protein
MPSPNSSHDAARDAALSEIYAIIRRAAARVAAAENANAPAANRGGAATEVRRGADTPTTIR